MHLLRMTNHGLTRSVRLPMGNNPANIYVGMMPQQYLSLFMQTIYATFRVRAETVQNDITQPAEPVYQQSIQHQSSTRRVGACVARLPGLWRVRTTTKCGNRHDELYDRVDDDVKRDYRQTR
jgi:hypothetical protein